MVYYKYRGVVFLEAETLSDMTIDDKVNFILNNANKVFIRKFCGISASKLLLLEKSQKDSLFNFLKYKIKNMPEETFNKKIKALY